jgi:hypothetical protein
MCRCFLDFFYMFDHVRHLQYWVQKIQYDKQNKNKQYRKLKRWTTRTPQKTWMNEIQLSCSYQIVTTISKDSTTFVNYRVINVLSLSSRSDVHTFVSQHHERIQITFYTIVDKSLSREIIQYTLLLSVSCV